MHKQIAERLITIDIKPRKSTDYPPLGNCNNFIKRKILVLNEMEQDEILLKLKV
jgi:hypothetical protein